MRENALCALAAGTASAAVAWLGLYGFAWNDYEVEAKPAFDALTHGHVLEFLRLVPAYGGSLVERAPFALIPDLWGGGQLAVYRMVALPCLLAGVALGVWLCARMRAAGRPTLSRAVVVGVCVANPLTLEALELGHPEELLGACLCVAAVVLAGRDRPVWAGLLLGVAIANKEWALLAAGPVLLALPAREGAGRRVAGTLCLAGAALAATALVLAPLALVSAGGFAASARAVAVAPGALFHPWQVWWFFGWHGPLVHGEFGIPLPGYRTGPVWAQTISHPLVVMVGAGMAGALWLRRGRGARAILTREALLLLALVLLLRCMLDTWNTGYYMLPFLIVLLAWEALGESRRAPLLTLASTMLPWLGLQGLSQHGASPDAQACVFLVWTLALATALGLTVYAPGLLSSAAGRRRRMPVSGPEAHPRVAACGPAQEMTVSSLGSPVSTS